MAQTPNTNKVWSATEVIANFNSIVAGKYTYAPIFDAPTSSDDIIANGERGEYRFLDGKTVKFLALDNGKSVNHDKDNLNTNMTRGWGTKEVTRDIDLNREYKQFIDVGYVRGSNGILSAKTLIAQYEVNQKPIELDSYTSEKLYNIAKEQNTLIEVDGKLTKDNILGILNTINNNRRKFGSSGGETWAFMNTEAMSALEDALGRVYLNGALNVNTGVINYNGLSLRLCINEDTQWSKFDSSYGFIKTEDAVEIKIAVVHKPSIIFPQIFNDIIMDLPSALNSNKYVVMNNWGAGLIDKPTYVGRYGIQVVAGKAGAPSGQVNP